MLECSRKEKSIREDPRDVTDASLSYVCLGWWTMITLVTCGSSYAALYMKAAKSARAYRIEDFVCFTVFLQVLHNPA